MRWSISMSAALLSCCVIFSTVSVTNSQLVPDEACAFLADMFKSLGCLQEKTPICQVLAFLFTIHTPTGGVLCNKFLCDGGYGQSPFDTECRETACSSSMMRPQGICPNCQTCCSIEV